MGFISRPGTRPPDAIYVRWWSRWPEDKTGIYEDPANAFGPRGAHRNRELDDQAVGDAAAHLAELVDATVVAEDAVDARLTCCRFRTLWL